jgi:hypothetical protein
MAFVNVVTTVQSVGFPPHFFSVNGFSGKVIWNSQSSGPKVNGAASAGVESKKRGIISFFIKVIYFFSLLDEDIDEIEKLDSMKKTKRLIETLFNKNEKIKVNFFTEFSQLKEKNNLSSKFIRLVANLNLSIII